MLRVRRRLRAAALQPRHRSGKARRSPGCAPSRPTMRRSSSAAAARPTSWCAGWRTRRRASSRWSARPARASRRSSPRACCPGSRRTRSRAARTGCCRTWLPRCGERKQWTGLRFTPGELGDNPFLALAVKLAPLLPDESLTPGKVAERLEADPARSRRTRRMRCRNSPPGPSCCCSSTSSRSCSRSVAERYRAPFVDLLAAAAQSAARAHRRDDAGGLLPPLSGVAEARGAAARGHLPARGAGCRRAARDDHRPGGARRARLRRRACPTAFSTTPAPIRGRSRCSPSPCTSCTRRRRPRASSRSRHTKRFGGVKGAISQRAEDTFEKLSRGCAGVARRRLPRLVEVDEHGVATRRRADACACRIVRPRRASWSMRSPTRGCSSPIALPTGLDGRGGARGAAARVAAACGLDRGESRDDLRAVRQAEAAAAEWQRAAGDATHLWPHERLVSAFEALSRLGMTVRELGRAGEVLPPARGRAAAGGIGAAVDHALSPRRDRRPARLASAIRGPASGCARRPARHRLVRGARRHGDAGGRRRHLRCQTVPHREVSGDLSPVQGLPRRPGRVSPTRALVAGAEARNASRASNIARSATVPPRTSPGTTRWRSAAGWTRGCATVASCRSEGKCACRRNGNGSRQRPAAIPTTSTLGAPDGSRDARTRSKAD